MPSMERARAAAWALLVAWCASFVAPIWHAHPHEKHDHSAAASVHGDADCESADASECDHGFRRGPPHDVWTSGCREGSDCRDPWHHHHRPARPHDDSHCPICSSLLERVVESSIALEPAPQRAVWIKLQQPRVSPRAARFVFHFARGPPDERFGANSFHATRSA